MFHYEKGDFLKLSGLAEVDYVIPTNVLSI